MSSRSILAVTGATVALGLVPAASALAGPSVSVRVEGPTSTLLPARTVTAPSSGSITQGGAPAGACPATSAAGALDRATRDRWAGLYSSGLGIEVTTILNTKLSFAKGTYWGFYVNGRYAAKGVCDTALHRGAQLLFAAIPAKGRAPRPIVLRAPTRAGAGEPFNVRAYEYTGHGSATVAVPGVRLSIERGGHGAGATVGRPSTAVKGVSRVSVPRAGRVTIVASAPHAIRSVAATVTVGR